MVSRTGLETTAIPGKRNPKLLKCLGRKYLLEASEGAFENFTLHLFLYFTVRHVPCIFCTLQEYHWGLMQVRA